MEAAPPVKPPRGVKYAKETSGLLMSVIRTLSASENNEQRDREKAKLEKEYKKSDQRLDELVSEHDETLAKVMQLFAKVSTQVTTSREKIHAVKENLHACKQLLRCRRDELKKLWLEGVEHKHVLQLLDDIDQLRKVPSQLSTLISKKHYLHATKMLVSAISQAEGNLKEIEALSEVREDLKQKQLHLHTTLLNDLKRHIYVQSTQDVFALRRQGSGRELFASPFQRSELRRSFNERVESKARRNLMDAMSNDVASRVVANDADYVVEDITVPDPEINSHNFMAVLIECLALLQKVPESVEVIKVEMQTELLSIISRTTQIVMDSPLFLPPVAAILNQSTIEQCVTSTPIKPTSSRDHTKQALLLDLLQTVFEQFRLVAVAHTAALKSFQKTVQKHNISVKLYEISDFWSRIQAVLQLLLTDYLDIQNISEPQIQASTFIDQPTDINSFFSRRKVQSKKRTCLFKFENSSHAISLSENLKEKVNACFGDKQPSASEQIEGSGTDVPVYGKKEHKRRDKVLVCPPAPTNITLMFMPVVKFIEEIERELGCKPGTPCTLNAFLADYMKEVFMGRHHNTISAEVEAVTKSHDAWRTIVSSDTMKEMSLNRSLLQSTVTVDKCISETRDLMIALPSYAENLFSIVCRILKQYRETCQAAYRGIVQPDTEDKRIYSAAWLKDEDISRFLKSLPNWLDLKAQHLAELKIGVAAKTQRRSVRPHEQSEEESPEDVRQRNLREAEILASNLGEGGIHAHEILSDVMVLKGLAILQESMEWFSARMVQLSNDMRRATPRSPSVEQNDGSAGNLIIKENSIKCLVNLAQEFDELANTCLLVLHLEVRVQCFHYLLPRGETYTRYYGSDSRDSHEPDSKVLELTKVLVSVDEAMSSTLHPRKIKYIFEGLGHLTAKILISAAHYMERIDEAGIQRMCRNVFAVQQTLTAITMTREVALDFARQYYEMLYTDPEEILNNILENGPQFTELEYMNAFQLIHRSRGNKDSTMLNNNLQKLSDILGDVGVTV